MTILCSPARARLALLAALVSAACGAACLPGWGGSPTLVAVTPDLSMPGCGNGVIDEGEECDQGGGNSDSLKDACRSNCLKSACGDRVPDTGEACDDGNALGGDGCTPLCTVEDPPLEREPNNEPGAANPWTAGVIRGAIPAGDRDCFSFDMPECAAVKARLLQCPQPATLTLVAPGGAAVATGGPAADRCAALDPAEAAGARFVAAGRWSLCVEGLLGGAVPFYALQIEIVAAKDASYPLAADDDRDVDGKPDSCDTDRDGDGVEDAIDNCPDVPNGPNAPGGRPLAPSKDGFIRQWLTAGAFVGKKSDKECRPTPDNLVAADDALARPALGDAAGPHRWIALWSYRDRLEFLDDYGKAAPPREVYQAAYVKSAMARDLTLGVGPDDGARVWFNGAMVLDIIACQGTNVDSSKIPVSLKAGWNTILIKVYDQGGGWGNFVRFLDPGNKDAPVTDLEISLSPDGPWLPDQTDSDKDGQGDACDKTPR